MVDFDPAYHCDWCWNTRKIILPFVFLPNATLRKSLPVMVCTHCDGKPLVELALKNAEGENAS